MDCPFGYEYGSEYCDDCRHLHICKEDDDFSQQEDYLMELARERDD